MRGRPCRKIGRCAVVAVMALGVNSSRSWCQGDANAGAMRIAEVEPRFAMPPDDARVMMRWWWFGPAVTKPEIEREILAMKAGGIGGFEIQPVYPMALDDASKGFRNLPYLSDEFLEDVSFAAKTAHANGMRIDMTLASGWPYGGKHVPVDEAAARLKVVAVDVAAGVTRVMMPALSNGETLLAVFAGEGTSTEYDAGKLRAISSGGDGDALQLEASTKPRVVVFYIAGRTGQQVKRAAVDAEGFVLDHFSRKAVEDHLKTVGGPLMRAFGEEPPYAVFSDSLEVYGADWTDDLPAEFKRRRGYDVVPHLPQLVAGTDESSAEVRHDWGLTLTELIDERYLTPVDEWAKAHHTRFRSQTYGDPAVSMSSNSLVALPEGEGPQWDKFSYTRWATSASHLYGRAVTSAETWTWLHSPPFSATPLDMKVEADRFFLEGVNQLIGHGWPYTPPGAAEPGWSFYAAAVFNDHNPWWGVMPEVTKYLQRVSYLLRQGKPANDVAVLLPDDDVYSEFKPGKVSLSADMPRYVTPALTQQILASGYDFDYVDAEAIGRLGIPYPVLVLPHVRRLSPETMKAIAAYVEHGGKVIAVGSKPERAPGLKDAAAATEVVEKLSQTLFANRDAYFVEGDDGLGAALRRVVEPDVKLSPGASGVGFIHRKLDDADVYFLANTSNMAVTTTASFRGARKFLSQWDPLTGDMRRVDGGEVRLDLSPYESVVVISSDGAIGEDLSKSDGAPKMIVDLTRDWAVHFPAEGKRGVFEEKLQTPRSWTDDAATQFFSGTAAYTKSFRLSKAELTGAAKVELDFGEGTPIAANSKVSNGMRALLDAPIRDVAVVTINGKRAGVVWFPPYRLDITRALHAGENSIEIRVSNTAINLLAGRSPADYRLLTARYGARFMPMDVDEIKPMPSGIVGFVHLLETK